MTHPKKLRDLYMKDKAAREFLDKHPEFNNRFIEQCDVKQPGFKDGGSYRLHEPEPSKREHVEMMRTIVRQMPKFRTRVLLEAYYEECLSIEQIKVRFGFRTKHHATAALHGAKKRALIWFTRAQSTRILDQQPLQTKIFTYKDETKFIYLVFDNLSKEHVWVDEKGEALPRYAQEVLNDDECEFKDWDEVWL